MLGWLTWNLECPQQCSPSWVGWAPRVSGGMVSGFYKVNIDSGLHNAQPVTTLQSTQVNFSQLQLSLGQCLVCDHSVNHPENIAAIHHFPQACKSPRAAHERLWCSFFFTDSHPKTSCSFGWSTTVKGFHDLWGGADHPCAKSAFGYVAPGGWGRVTGSYGVWVVVYIKFQFLHQCQVFDHFAKMT